MARIRSIKPEFWTSAQIMDCSPMARLMFIGMWNFADDAGRMAYSPKTLKAQIYPSDDVTIEAVSRLIDELSSNDLVLIYGVENKQFIQITGWHHQKIDRPKPSKLPDPFVETSTRVRRKVATDLILSDPILKEESRLSADAPKTRERKKVTYPEDFETRFWKRYAKGSKDQACRQWKKLSPEDQNDACKAIEQYHRDNPDPKFRLDSCRYLSYRRWENFVSNGTAIVPAFDIRAHLV